MGKARQHPGRDRARGRRAAGRRSGRRARHAARARSLPLMELSAARARARRGDRRTRGERSSSSRRDLIRFDTTAREPGDPPRDGGRAAGAARRHGSSGAGVRDRPVRAGRPDALAGRAARPAGARLRGTPAAHRRASRAPAAAAASSLNGHIDVVPADAAEGWTSPPFAPEVRDGLLYGRGACDMKGGIAAMVVAAEVLAAPRRASRGDLIVATNTDEESSGAGGVALRRPQACAPTAAIVTEPTGSRRVDVSCRGSTYATITVPGRAGHAEIAHPRLAPGRRGECDREGARSCSTRSRRLRERWAADPALRHPRLSRRPTSCRP